MLRTIMAALAALTLSTAAMAAECTTDTPVTIGNLIDASDAWNNGETAHFAGTANCPSADDTDAAVSELLAISAALSTPVWLEAGERFAVSGGLGFSGDGDTALGATGVMRFDKNLSGFAGAAVGTESSDQWAGKAGVRVGW